MDLDLRNKIVFITGASSGIGAAAAQIFSAEGAEVVVSYGNNLAGAEQTAAKMRANGQKNHVQRIGPALACHGSFCAPQDDMELTAGGIGGRVEGMDSGGVGVITKVSSERDFA